MIFERGYAGGDDTGRYRRREIDCVEFRQYSQRFRWGMSQVFFHEFHNNDERPDENFNTDPACDWWDRQVEHEPEQAPIGDRIVVPRELRNLRPELRTKKIRKLMSEEALRVHRERRAGTLVIQPDNFAYNRRRDVWTPALIAYAAIINKRLEPVDFQI